MTIVRLLFGLCCALIFCAALAQDDAALHARVIDIASDLRCVVCQNQSIADSNAPLAADLRTQVAEQLRAGKRDEEIIAFMAERYGSFILYRPPLKADTWLLWSGPLLFLLLGLVFLFRRATHDAMAGEGEKT